MEKKDNKIVITLEDLVKGLEALQDGDLKISEEDNLEYNKYLNKLYIKDKHIKEVNVKWNSNNNKPLLYGNFNKNSMLTMYFYKLLKPLTYVFIIDYNNMGEYRLIVFKNFMLYKTYKIEEISKFLSIFPAYAINDYFKEEANFFLMSVVKNIRVLPADGYVRIEDEKIKFIDRVIRKGDKNESISI